MENRDIDSDKKLQDEIHKQLERQSNINDIAFASKISSLSRREQFIFTMQRWSQQIYETWKTLEWLIGIEETWKIPIGSYIYSNKTNKYYLNLGIEAKTLQGCIYIGCPYDDSFISTVINSENGSFSNLISKYLLQTQDLLAIKYYDKNCCDLGITLNGLPVKEKALQEIKLLKSIFKNGSKYSPIVPWLQKPYKNIIKLYENWEDKIYDNKKCYFAILEYANCGELLLFIDSYHSIIYRDKKLNIQRIDKIKNNKLRQLSINIYRNSLTISRDGVNAYIEFIKFIFQQMVQSIYVLHSQGIAHLDISCENFVLHFDKNGQFLVKLIDLGRAVKCPIKKCSNDKYEKYEYEYEKYDFNVSTYPGKCRYMSPESALFLKYKHANKYNASKEDIYALGVVLFCMLTCSLPYDTPFYINDNGHLNGNKKYKIDINSNINEIDIDLDDNFKLLHENNNGLLLLLQKNCLLDYVSYDSLDLLNKIITKESNRISLGELINHPFVQKPPNPQLLMSMIQHVIDYKRLEYTNQQKYIQNKIIQINKLYKNRLNIQAKKILFLNKQKQINKELKLLIDNIPLIEPPIIKPIISTSIKTSSNTSSNTSTNNNIKKTNNINFKKTNNIKKTNNMSNINNAINNEINKINTINDIVPSLDLQLNITQSLVSPSPPPQTTYACSPSPEISFSPSPEPDIQYTQSQSPPQTPQHSQQSRQPSHDHTNVVHSLLKNHFHKTCQERTINA